MCDVGQVSGVLASIAPNNPWDGVSRCPRDHGLVMSPELIQSGWQPRDGWMTVEQWEKWVLAGWKHQDVLARTTPPDRSCLGHSCNRHGAGHGIVRAGGAFAGVDKAWTQWLKKFRRALKSRRKEAWVLLRRRRTPSCGMECLRTGGPTGMCSQGTRWCVGEAWMAEPEVLTTSVWLHPPNLGWH